jgi:hypothetical protein
LHVLILAATARDSNDDYPAFPAMFPDRRAGAAGRAWRPSIAVSVSRLLVTSRYADERFARGVTSRFLGEKDGRR